jgi:hypothetical protein
MTKTTDLGIDFQVLTLNSQRVARLFVSTSALREWCLCVQLLQDRLVDSCVFRNAATFAKLNLRHGQQSSFQFADRNNVLTVCCSPNDLDVIRHFFLKYFRDGLADVDHLDIETEACGGGYLTFIVEESKNPCSPSVARQRLGL